MKKIIQISVRTLVESVYRSGDLGVDFLSITRLTEGTQLHKKIQKSRPDEYTAEVSITHRMETDYSIVEISGKIDGVYRYPDRVIVEEIKTTSTNPDTWESNENPVHWAQLKCYAYFYSVEFDLNEINTQLVYYHTKTGNTKEFQRCFGKDELECFFKELISHYLEEINTLEGWSRVRDQSIRNMDFPYPVYRTGQREMAVDVFMTIKQGSQCIVQAPTGIGKTIASIFPAIKALGEGYTSKIFYLTARTTGREAAENALNELRRNGLRIKSLTITAKEKICFHPEIFCNSDECPCAIGYYDRIEQASQEGFQYDFLSRKSIEETAQKFNVCPFELSLDMSLWADCIICDYNYAFDPRVYLKRYFLEGKGDYTFLIDEAHNLVDRAREMFSAEIWKQPFVDVRRVLKNELPDIYKIMGKINSWFLKVKKEYEIKNEPYAEMTLPEEIIPLLRKFTDEVDEWLSRNQKTLFRKELVDLYYEVSWFVSVSERYNGKYVSCFEKIHSDLRIKLFCVDPSERLSGALTRCNSVILFSATMTPAAYFRKILGCDESARIRILPSPFPEENLCVMIVDTISTLYNQRTETVPDISQSIYIMIQQKRGNYLLFFPSYQYMKMIYEYFSGKYPAIEAVIQTSGMKESEREIFLERFAHDNTETLVGFAVMGGIFGEGIDLVGDRLTGAAIVGVGLPGICLERDLIREYFDTDNGSGFEFAYMYPGINRVLQAAGRVIRSENDRGVVLLIDRRFSSSRYQSLFPREWNPVIIKNEQKLLDTVQDFWED